MNATVENAADVANALTRQKDALLAMLGRATDAGELSGVKDYLDFAAPAWEASGYGYKAGEVNRLVIDRARAVIRDEEGQLPHYRRGTRLHNVTLHEIAALGRLVDRCQGFRF